MNENYNESDENNQSKLNNDIQSDIETTISKQLSTATTALNSSSSLSSNPDIITNDSNYGYEIQTNKNDENNNLTDIESSINTNNNNNNNIVAIVKDNNLDDSTMTTNYSNCNKNFSLLVVAIALLLDGMLNMVILPIIPEYVKYLPNQNISNATSEKKNMFDYNRNDVAIGFLFASKPFIQLVISPFIGTLIDSVGYEVPMLIGLLIQFISTMIFTYTDSLVGLFSSRALQGVGSAMAATSGFTMIAYFFRTHFERSKALGIVITSLALGSFMSVPFSGFLFQYVSKKSPFIVLACISMLDAILLLISIHVNCNTVKRFRHRDINENERKQQKKKYIWTLFFDPYIAICSVSLIMANVPLAFTEPTIAIWMKKTMNSTESEIGLIWLSGFLPHLFGVYLTVFLIKYFAQHQWLFIGMGLVLEALSCLSIPFITSYNILFLPICIICFGYGLIDATILPTMVNF